MRRCVHGGGAAALVAIAALAVSQCSGPNTVAPGPTGPPPPVAETQYFVGAGDIADCAFDNGSHAEATAQLVEQIVAQNPAHTTVFAAGDLAYFDGSMERFNNCYNKNWGRFKSRTRPTPGNHEYETPGAMAYFNYFRGIEGSNGSGFYSYNLGAWHIVSLNSYIAAGRGSEQFVWLQDDLASHAGKCQLAYWHYPRFTSGPSATTATARTMIDMWTLLMDFGVDVVISGHDHFYERFDPQNANGDLAPNGIREFMVGTGGTSFYSAPTRARNSAFGPLAAHGVLKLSLRSDAYTWELIEVNHNLVPSDIGSAQCH